MAGDKDKKPPPPKPLREFVAPSRRALLGAGPPPLSATIPLRSLRGLTLPPPLTGPIRLDGTQAPLTSPPPLGFLAPWVEGGMDLLKGLTVGAESGYDTPAAQMGELVQAGLPLVGGLKGLATTGRGLYSRVDDALRLIPTKGAHPNKVASLLKSNASAEELAYRQVPEFLAEKGNATVTQAELAAHLAAHPAPMPQVVTRGDPPAALITARGNVDARARDLRAAALNDPADWVGVNNLDRINALWWAQEAAGGDARALQKLQDVAVDPDHLETLLAFGRAQNESTALGRQIEAVPTRKYQTYQVPGGENYRETLLTLPGQPASPRKSAVDIARDMGYGPDDPLPLHVQQEIQREIDASVAVQEGQRQFRTSHWEQPNVVVHTRSNERTLPTGEPGRFVEEVQSDWHQAGKREGYQLPPAQEADLRARYNALAAEKETVAQQRDPRTNVMLDEPRWHELSREQEAIMAQVRGGVPDAPFKETWPDLGLKQQVLEAAADPHAQWIGHTSGATQAARYDLSKQLDEIHYQPGQERLLAFDKSADKVMDRIVPADQLADYIGKEGAQKLLAQPFDNEYRTSHVLRGADLQVGGEGMKHFYDNLLPKRLEKILKPFGGTVERGTLGGRTKAEIDAEMDALSDATPVMTANFRDAMERLQAERNAAHEVTPEMWFARLTPEMKARILKEGLPLSLLLGMVPLSQLGQPAPPEAR